MLNYFFSILVSNNDINDYKSYIIQNVQISATNFFKKEKDKVSEHSRPSIDLLINLSASFSVFILSMYSLYIFTVLKSI